MKFNISGKNDENMELTYQGLKNLYKLNIERTWICIIAGFGMIAVAISALLDLPYRDSFPYLIIEILIVIGLMVEYNTIYKKYRKVFQNDVDKQGIKDKAIVKYEHLDIVAFIVFILIIIGDLMQILINVLEMWT